MLLKLFTMRDNVLFTRKEIAVEKQESDNSEIAISRIETSKHNITKGDVIEFDVIIAS